MPRPRRCRDSSDHVGTMSRHCRGRDGSDHEGTNRRSRRRRDRSDHVDTRRGSHHGRGRSGSSSGSDRAPLPRKRSRASCGSLAPLRGYCEVRKLRKAQEETRLTALELTNAKEETRLTALELTEAKEETRLTALELTKAKEETRLTALELTNAKEATRLTALELTKALEAEKECRNTITDLVNENRSLWACNRSMSKELTRVFHELAINQERGASLIKARNHEQEQLERQLSVALQSAAALQDCINELSQWSRNHERIDHCVKRAKPMDCEHATGPDDLSEQSPLSADDESMTESTSVTSVPSQQRNQPEVVKETAVGTNGVQNEISTSEQSESLEPLGDDDPGAEKDAEQPLPPEDSTGVGAGRSSMPSPCGEPRAFEVGDASPKQSFQ